MKNPTKKVLISLLVSLLMFSFALDIKAQEKKPTKKKRVIGMEIGNILPSFTLNDNNGNPVTLSKLRGKVMIVEFWGSWCKYCRKANPDMVLMYNKFKSEDFEMIGVAIDESREEWLEAIKKDKLPWLQVSEQKNWPDSKIVQKYKLEGVPSKFLLDRKGVILAINPSDEEIDNAIKKPKKEEK